LYTKFDLYTNLCHNSLGGADVKKRDVEKHLKNLGWWLLREGGNHEVWKESHSDDLAFVPQSAAFDPED
jgi:predicted RNA binding protein YcfA (HicA-like mRNA interferase family)